MAISKRVAFTLLEIIVVVAILLVIASIISPVIVKAAQAGKETATKNNLHQIYLGLMLYREKYDSKVEFGATVDMGLPVGMASSPAYLEVVNEKRTWRSPCCCHKDGSTGFPDYTTYFIDYSDFFTDEDYWLRYVNKYQSSAVMVADYHCNPTDLALYSPVEPIKLIGVRLNGKIETRVRTADPGLVQEFWGE